MLPLSGRNIKEFADMFQNHYNACAIDMLEHILCQVSIYQQHSIIERTSDWKSKVLNKSLSAVWGWDFNTHLWGEKAVPACSLSSATLLCMEMRSVNPIPVSQTNTNPSQQVS